MLVNESSHLRNGAGAQSCRGHGEHRTELRLGKICRRLAQDRVGLAQLSVLALKRHETINHLGRHPGALAAIDLDFLLPLMKRLRNAADFRCERQDECPPWRMSAFVIQDHPSRTCANLRYEFVRCLTHRRPFLARSEGLRNRGAVHTNILAVVTCEFTGCVDKGCEYSPC